MIAAVSTISERPATVSRLQCCVVPENYSVRTIGRTSTFHDQHPQQLDFVMAVGAISEAVTITTQTPKDRHAKIREPETMVQPSQNVVNLQRRAAGVLPVRVDVPCAGTSHHFLKPLWSIRRQC